MHLIGGFKLALGIIATAGLAAYILSDGDLFYDFAAALLDWLND